MGDGDQDQNVAPFLPISNGVYEISGRQDRSCRAPRRRDASQTNRTTIVRVFFPRSAPFSGISIRLGATRRSRDSSAPRPLMSHPRAVSPSISAPWDEMCVAIEASIFPGTKTIYWPTTPERCSLSRSLFDARGALGGSTRLFRPSLNSCAARGTIDLAENRCE